MGFYGIENFQVSTGWFICLFVWFVCLFVCLNEILKLEFLSHKIASMKQSWQQNDDLQHVSVTSIEICCSIQSTPSQKRVQAEKAAVFVCFQINQVRVGVSVCLCCKSLFKVFVSYNIVYTAIFSVCGCLNISFVMETPIQTWVWGHAHVWLCLLMWWLNI